LSVAKKSRVSPPQCKTPADSKNILKVPRIRSTLLELAQSLKKDLDQNQNTSSVETFLNYIEYF
jgi:hypothetical protein